MNRIALLTSLCLGLAGAPAFAEPTATPAPAAPAASAAPITASKAVDNVQDFYSHIQQVSAKFRQYVTNSTFGSKKSSDGAVWLVKPGKMRFDYYEKTKGKVETKKSFISNGTTLYMVEHDNKQVVKKDLKADLMPVALSFLFGKGDLNKEFTAVINPKSEFSAADSIALELTPKQPSAQYKMLILVVSTSDFHVRQSIIIDSSDNKNQFEFFEPDFQKPIQSSSFEFDPKSVPSYRVIDANQPPAAGSGAAPAPAPAPVPVAPPPAPPAAPPATK